MPANAMVAFPGWDEAHPGWLDSAGRDVACEQGAPNNAVPVGWSRSRFHPTGTRAGELSTSVADSDEEGVIMRLWQLLLALPVLGVSGPAFAEASEAPLVMRGSRAPPPPPP